MRFWQLRKVGVFCFHFFKKKKVFFLKNDNPPPNLLMYLLDPGLLQQMFLFFSLFFDVLAEKIKETAHKNCFLKFDN